MRMREGYTLIELLVVLALASLLMTSVPYLSNNLLPGAQFQKTFKGLIDDLARTRGLAMTSGKPQVFDLSSYGDALHFHTEQSDEDAALVFWANGMASAGTLVLRVGDRERSIDINWLTGFPESRIGGS